MADNKRNSVLKKFVGNTSWMMFKNIYSMLVSLIVGSLSARFLGPSNYGLLNYGSSIITFFTTVSKLGMDSVIVAEIVRRPDKENSYLGTALTMRLITSILSFFAVWGFVLVLEPNHQLLQIVTVLQATAIIFQSTEVFYFWFQAKMEMKYVTLASMAALTATGVWRIVLLINKASVGWFAFSASISALVCGVCICVFFVRKARIRLSCSIEDGKYILNKSYHFIINGLAVTLYTQLDRIMLGKMINETIVGFYAAASTLAIMWEFVPTSIINSATPLLVKIYDQDRKRFVFQYQMLLAGISGLSIIVGIAFTIFSKLFISILYGKAYLPAVPVLSILIWSTGFAMIGTARGIWIIAAGKNKYSKYFTIIGAIINAVLNMILIPVWGIVGAAFTTLLSQVIVALVAPIFFSETKEFIILYFGAFKKIPLYWKQLKKYIL